MQEVEFTFKASSDVFPTVVLTPKGWEGEPVEISAAGPVEIRKGAYTLEATCEGFREAKAMLSVSSTLRKYDVKMTKVSATAPTNN